MEDQNLVTRRKSGLWREGYSLASVKQPPISDANVLRLARAFGLKNPEIFTYNHGYRNHSFGILAEGKKYNLMLLKNEPTALERMQNADLVSQIVAAAGLPARLLADPRTLKAATDKGYRLARLYYWLEGSTIPWEAYTRKHLRELGKTLAELHASLANTDLPLPDALTELTDYNDTMQAYFAKSEVQKALTAKLNLKTRINYDKIARFLGAQPLQGLARQPLHLDFVRGNILWATPKSLLNPTISGIIDFEKTAAGSPLIDLARTYAFLLVDCPKSEPKIAKYFLHSGYIKYGKSQLLIPPKIFYNMTNFFLLFDFYKFLSHNPYEDLENNYHFCRTRDILLVRNILEEL
ncbi:aminoglycoside phosphotransferase family protein [Candidatus Saccharibacteria bacterium]|nr:aminoglycoside phosphotransferase family protein [Candidatus Saccharibacteria bacterium]